MGVKEIDKNEFYMSKPSSKRALFKADILEILRKRIEYCELTDFPYSMKTGISDILSQARNVFAHEYRMLTGKRLKSPLDVPFIMTKTKNADGTMCIRCAFNVHRWDEMIKEAKEEINENV